MQPTRDVLNESLSPEKERQILRGAAAIFAQDGYEGASMSRIAAQAGVSKGTLYNYFESKADLFATYVHAECRSSLAVVFEDVCGNPDPAATLRGIGLRLQRLMFSPEGLTIYRVVLAEAAKFPELAQTFYDAGPAMAIAYLSRWLQAQAAIGCLRVPDPVLAAEQFYALCRTRYGLCRELQLLREPPPGGIETIVDAAVEMFLSHYQITS